MYQKAKNLFSPFASTEDPYHDALSMFWQLPVESTIGGLAQTYMRGYQIGQYTTGASLTLTNAVAYPGVPRGVTAVPYTGVLSANLFVIPFESISAVFNHREDAFACRGIDTRGLSSIEISGNLSVFDTKGILEGTNEPESVFPKNDTYVVYANLVYDEMISILSGRVDKNASYALIPGSSSTPSGAQ